MALQTLYIGPIQFRSSELRQRISSVCIARGPFEVDVAAGSAVHGESSSSVIRLHCRRLMMPARVIVSEADRQLTDVRVVRARPL